MLASMRRGRFIVFEGGEGTGKSTQAGILAAALRALLTREPGGTETGERIRALVLDRSGGALGARTELLLVAAARAQHVEELIAPTLAAGRDVVCDRFAGSTLAYQGYGRGLPLEEVRAASSVATGGLVPDLTVLIELAPEVAATRRCGSADRIESESPEFHDKVREGFATLAADDPSGWAVVSGLGSRDEVAARVLAEVEARLGRSTPVPDARA